MSQKNRNDVAYLLERRWKSWKVKGAQRGIAKISNCGKRLSYLGRRDTGRRWCHDEPRGQGHRTEGAPHSKRVHGDTGPRKDTKLQLKEPPQAEWEGNTPVAPFHRLSSFLTVPSTGQSHREANWGILGNVACRVQPHQCRQRRKGSIRPGGRHRRASSPGPMWYLTCIAVSSSSTPRNHFPVICFAAVPVAGTKRTKRIIATSTSNSNKMLSRLRFVLLPFEDREEKFFCCSQHQYSLYIP